MLTFDREYFNLGYLDTLAYKDTFVHRLDPRIKLITTIFFIFTVVSFTKYELSGLMPFFIFPVFMMVVGEIPARFILKKVIIVSPFVLFVAVFNPLFDTATMYDLHGFMISGGWISSLSIIMRFLLTISAVLLLIATTSFPAVCQSLERLFVPRIFVIQLFFLYRYLFVLAEESMRMVRAVNMRTFGRSKIARQAFINLIGLLFMKTVERSERIYQCMCSRGFNDQVRLLRRERIGFVDIIFAIVSIALFIGFRRYDVAKIMGVLVLGR
jgi:cobalt/nickel transport system permease protein